MIQTGAPEQEIAITLNGMEGMARHHKISMGAAAYYVRCRTMDTDPSIQSVAAQSVWKGWLRYAENHLSEKEKSLEFTLVTGES